MKVEIIFATHNFHKVKEANQIIGKNIKLISLKDLGYNTEIEEPFLSLEENSLTKALTVYEFFGKSVVAEDTGLEVKSLQGEPGVFSARYAGQSASDNENINKLLKKLEQFSDRTARFRTVLTFIANDDTKMQFEGVIDGKISTEPKGTRGFGYDPVFIPKGYNNTFAELGDEIKKKLSHRAVAFNSLNEFLKSFKISD